MPSITRLTIPAVALDRFLNAAVEGIELCERDSCVQIAELEIIAHHRVQVVTAGSARAPPLILQFELPIVESAAVNRTNRSSPERLRFPHCLAIQRNF